jgi:MFS family permease
MQPAPGRTLWRHPDFVKLWIGQTISELGSRITLQGLPITAALMLDATPAQMGVLAALNGLATMIIGLPVGVWIDRVRRKPVMIGADIGRAIVLATIPFAAWNGTLTLTYLYIISTLTGIMTVCFDVAYQSYVPSLVDRSRVLEANSKLAVSVATAEIAGPAVTGVLIQMITAPLAILLDAVSFLGSATCIVLIRKPEPPPSPPPASHLREETLAGLHSIWTNRALRALAGRSVTTYLFFGFFATLYLLFVIRDLGISPGLLGVIISVGGIGSMCGALLAERITRRFGIRRTFVVSSLVVALASTLIPLAGGPIGRSATFLIVQQLIGDCAMVIFMTNELSFRQRVTPDDHLGRVNAAMQILTRGVLPIGAVAGGIIGGITGTRTAMAIAVAGIWLSNLWLFQLPRKD